ncbi:MAG: UDP-N-acetylglucosamine O-acyltransferase [Phycisphaerae bacterium]
MPEVEVLREIDPAARIAPDAKIGPFCVIGPHVTIGPRTILRRRVTVTGHTTIGTGNVFDEGCVIGLPPQDLKYRGEPTLLHIGHNNYFGRRVTAHVGTEVGGYLTRVGNGNKLMDSSHVAHDCFVDDNTRIGSQVLLAGHIRVQTGAVLETMAGCHHFTTIGRYARVGPRTPVRRDVPPFTDYYSPSYDWVPPAVRGIHEAGIEAANLAPLARRELRRALHELFDDELALQTKIEQLVDMGVEGEVAALCEFCQRSLRGVYGRDRETYRGKYPPEAIKYLPPELLKDNRRILE